MPRIVMTGGSLLSAVHTYELEPYVGEAGLGPFLLVTKQGVTHAIFGDFRSPR